MSRDSASVTTSHPRTVLCSPHLLSLGKSNALRILGYLSPQCLLAHGCHVMKCLSMFTVLSQSGTCFPVLAMLRPDPGYWSGHRREGGADLDITSQGFMPGAVKIVCRSNLAHHLVF